MASITIDTTPEKLLAYRSTKNKEFFMNYIDDKLYFYCNTDDNFILKAYIPNPRKYKDIFKYNGVPIQPESLMIPTHNFSTNEEWFLTQGETPSSVFTCKPYAGYKLVITSIVTRFPADADLSANPMKFVIYKNIPAYGGLVPAITQTYSSIQQLLLQSNSPWFTVEFSQDNLFSGKMIEVRFRYADDDTNDFSKLQLSSKLGEKIEVSLTNDTHLLDVEGNALNDPCYAIFNTKRILEF